MTDQSETGNPTVGLDTDTIESIIKTSPSHRITWEFDSPPVVYGHHTSVLSPTRRSVVPQYTRVSSEPAM
eukprot:2955504-Pyramimonas_sp.AAC.1